MEEVVLNPGHTAWMLMSTGLVTLMIPGLALFYGGMVRVKSVLNMMMMSFGALALVFVIWIAVGFSLVFGDSVGDRGLIGNANDFLFLKGLDNSTALIGEIPAAVFIGFQGLFAAITVALISGSIADRAKFGTWMIFAGVWVTLVYFPVAHWVFAFDDFVAKTGGWIANDLGALDFAGGTAVHINAGAAGLALALILGKRIGFGKVPMRPHSLPLVMLGAALLWFGWFGFNAGSAVAANGTAGLALLNTIGATTAAVLAWLLVEKIRDGHATSLGAASGVVAGLVAITPACAAVNASGALIIGAVAGALCALSVGLKFKFGYDDSLDVVAVHLVGGIVGTIMIGFVGVEVGLFDGGGTDQLVKQIIGAGAVLAYSFIATLIIGKVIDMIFGFRITADQEVAGIDVAIHAERAYELSDNSQGSVLGVSKGGQS
ncbi:ammonium transporter [freshwater metagenome]|jgi:Amt family ammonium transporter|uniref:Ammonium transporter n=1 Tax=freshwater metagenome TaxID=449393 RepID=A0A094PWI6_9ZZZZ